METVKSRSKSPFSKSKAKNQGNDTPEDGDEISEQIKSKRKSQRSKAKVQMNGKENDNIEKNGHDGFKDDLESNHIENNVNNIGQEGSGDHEAENANRMEDNDLTITSNEPEEKSDEIVNEVIDVEHVVQEEVHAEVSTSSDEEVVKESAFNNFEEDRVRENGNSSRTNETECSSNKDITVEDSDFIQLEMNENGTATEENAEKKSNGEFNGISDTSIQEEEIVEPSTSIEESQNGFNSSVNDSHSENADTSKEDSIQASPDTATKEENYFSNKITNFLGKWNSSPMPPSIQKQDSEISSSKKTNDFVSTSNEPILIHPYLSKVSGRPGIRDRISVERLSSNGEKFKTPRNSELTLDDSFRVRTDPPPRMNRSDFQENPTLRKYRGKRCLSANDDDKEVEDDLSLTKRRKLDEKEQEGLLGKAFWSPFKKKSAEGDEAVRVGTSESKITRFLSPFWFWRKRAEEHKAD